MLIDPTAFWKRVHLGEDTGVELKEVRFRGRNVAAPKRNDLADGFAAFANSGGGWFVLGVRDDRAHQALTPGQLDSVAEMVTEICADNIQPPLDFNLQRMPAPESGDGGVLLVDIPRGAEVHRSPGGFFRRRGAGKRQIETAELRRLLQARARSEETGADLQSVADTGVESLARKHWRRYASSRSSDSPEVMLTKLKFLRDDEFGTPRATVGGILLASDDPRQWLPNAYIQAVCYSGGTRDGNRQLDAQGIGGPLDEQIRGAMRFVVRNRRVAARKDPARTDIPQYSERAVFEAVVNAVVHRDYGVAGSRIRLFMFDDRLELISPGSLGNSLTVEDLRTSQFTRNELLASRLGQCPVGEVPGSGGRRHFIERRGEGIGVIEDETVALAGSKPVFEPVGEREFMVTLPAASPPLPDGLATRVAVRQADTARPLRDVHVVVLYPNKTYLETRTDAFGHADFELYAELPLT
ncbi:MAG: putative DNA binding domain-containing protein, partial [Gemmatimonadota bacterium]|nr:putative DNA binding domain-containing protein [Gemmatimonadota bacterium]